MSIARGRLLWIGMICLQLAGCPTPKRSPSPTSPPPKTATPTPSPTPLPETVIPYSRRDTARLYNGIELRSQVNSSPGSQTPILTRRDRSAYVLDLRLAVQIPRPAATFDEVNQDQLDLCLSHLRNLVNESKVSSFYYGLYQLKVEGLQRNLNRLDLLLSRHNFFDCNTILEIKDANTARKALLIQSDMDVNADGSDADRTDSVDGSSTNFQPTTSYRWNKRTPRPSQFLPALEDKLKPLQAQLENRSLSNERKKSLRDQIDYLQKQIGELNRFSFLVAKEDPYIVLPGFLFHQATHPFAPRLGDLAVIIFHGKLYPAILGDIGPSDKIGEASLRLAAQLDAKSTADIRPSSDLNVTYLVFPGTAENPPGPPDLKKLRELTDSLLKELGGYTGQLWAWEDLLATPTPEPSATVSGSATPTTEPSPTVSASATPSAVATQPVSNPTRSARR